MLDFYKDLEFALHQSAGINYSMQHLQIHVRRTGNKLRAQSMRV